jgi:hypothetical protein
MSGNQRVHARKKVLKPMGSNIGTAATSRGRGSAAAHQAAITVVK